MTPNEIQLNRNKLIEALKSGEYAQGIGYLKSNRGRYCVMGVACVIFDVSLTRNQVVPPTTLQEILGYSSKEIEHITNLNDWGATFVEIADNILQAKLKSYSR